MFTKNISKSVLAVAVFAVIAIATPVFVSDTLTVEIATAEAFGSSGGDGGDSGGGRDSGCGSCGGGSRGGNNGGGGYTPPPPPPPPPPQPPVCQYLKANGKTGTLHMPAGGGNVNLQWKSVRGTSATLNGSGVAVNGSKNVTVTSDKTFTYRVNGQSGSDTCKVHVKVPQHPAAKCDLFTAKPDSFYNGVGGQVTLTWETTNAQSVSIAGIGNFAAGDGSTTVNLSAAGKSLPFTQTYTLSAIGVGGNASCKDTVTVYPKPDNKLTCQDVSFTASNTTVTPGSTVNLAWVFTGNVESASINPNVANPMSVNNVDVVVNNDVTYTMKIANDRNNVSCPLTIKVVDEPGELTCQDVVFTASDNNVAPGSTVNLSWVFTGNVESASLSPNVADPFAVNNVDVVVNSTQTYNMNIGNSKNNVSCPVTIKVDEPEVLSCENNVTFTASDTSLPKGGGDVTLTWTTTGIDSINIAGVASNNLNDSEVVNVTSDTTYTLEATSNGETINCPLKIEVATGGGGGGSSRPRCDLDISDDRIKAGEEVTLEWNTSRANEVRIEDNHGNVLIDTDEDDELDGEITIRPTKDTTFTLNASRGSRDRECEVEVEVEESVVVFESRTQDPRVAGISLTQVPYTGFEAGPALTMLFYTVLTLWGLFVAYVVVIRRDRVAGVSLEGAHDHVAYADYSVDAANTAESSVAEGYVYEATTQDVPANLPTAQPLDTVVGYDQYVEKKMMEK